jgi:hypothetical protein
VLRALGLILSTVAVSAAVESFPGFDEVRPLLERSLTEASGKDLAAHADLPFYRIAARWDEQRRLLIGTARIAWRNDSREPVRDLGFNTFPDSACFEQSSLAVSGVSVDGAPTPAPRFVSDGAGMVVDLPRPIAPGAWAAIEVPFALAPSRTDGYHGLGVDRGADICLYAWYPELAARLGGGWDTHPLAGLCDPTAQTMSHVLVDLDVPASVSVACGGSVVDDRAEGDRRRLTIAGAFTRDLVLTFAERRERVERMVGGTRVVSWFKPGDDAGGAAALDLSAQSLELYGQTFGAYPYAEFAAVQVPLGDDVGGMESSGLVLVDDSCYRALRHAGANPPPMAQMLMAICVSHEVGHQWWYGLVGSDAWTSAWLDESLTNWACCWYLDERGGPGLVNAGWSLSLMECKPPSAVAMPATLDAGDYAEEDYGAVIYGRGALMYQALRRQMGEKAFFAFLRSWFEKHEYGRVDGAQWRAALAESMGADAADAFARKWLGAEGLTRRDLAEATRPIPKPAPAAHADP